jgi:hypothetical protein
MNRDYGTSECAVANGLCSWLIRFAARHLTADLSLRLEEEWLADLDSNGSRWSRLKFSLGCCWASVVIATENARHARQAVVTPTNAIAVGRGSLTVGDSKLPYFSLRPGTLFLTVGLHVALLYGLILPL